MSLTEIRNYAAVRARLRNPVNAVEDRPINLRDRRKYTAVPIRQCERPQVVPVQHNSIFLVGGYVGKLVEIPFPSLVGPSPIAPKIHADYPSLNKIVRAVCDHYSTPNFIIRKVDLVSQRRTKMITAFRHVAMYLAYRLTTNSHPAIGNFFGGRDHTTCLSAVRKLDNRVNSEPAFRDEIEILKKKIMGDAYGLDG